MRTFTLMHHGFRTILVFLTGMLACKAIAGPSIEIRPGDSQTVEILASAGSNSTAVNLVIQESKDLVHWTSIAGAAPPPLTITTPSRGTMFFRALGQPPVQIAPFAITASDLTAYVSPGTLFLADGGTIEYPGGALSLFDNLTNYVVLNLSSLRLHSLVRAIGDDSILLAIVSISNGQIQRIEAPPVIQTPPTRLGGLKAKLSYASPITVAELGDSLTQGAGSGYMWWDLLFNTQRADFGYTIPHAANVTQMNYALGGSSAEYALALLGPCLWDENSGITAWQLMGLAFDNYYDTGNPAFPVSSSGPSQLASSSPDLVIFGYGNNPSSYQYIAVESCMREFVTRGWEGLMLTGNANSNAPTAAQEIGDNMVKLRSAYGFPIADTWAYVDEINRRGTNTYFDSVHQNQTGWLAWAEAIGGVLNPYSQGPLGQTLPASRVISLSDTNEAPSQFSSAEYVYTPCEAQGALRVGAPGLSGNVLPLAFNLDQSKIVFDVSVGGYLSFANDAWSAASLLIERGLTTNSFAANVSWIDCGASPHFLKTVTFADSNSGAPTVELLPIATITDMLPAIRSLATDCGDGLFPNYNNGGIRITVTNGNARVIGCVFFTPGKHSYRFEDISTLGQWAIDTQDPFGFVPKMLETDTLGDAAFLPFQGSGVMVIFRTSQAGGQLDAYLDQVKVLDSFSTYASGGYADKPVLFRLPLGPVPSAAQAHSLLLRLTAVRTNALQPSPGLHRLTLIKVATVE